MESSQKQNLRKSIFEFYITGRRGSSSKSVRQSGTFLKAEHCKPTSNEHSLHGQVARGPGHQSTPIGNTFHIGLTTTVSKASLIVQLDN